MDTGLFTPQASLNLATAVIGHPGDAKSEAMDGARITVPTPENSFEGVLGSGQGIAEAYIGEIKVPNEDRNSRKKTITIRKQIRWNVFLSLDEGRDLERLDQMKGATTLQTIRTAWTGKPIGATNASVERKRNVRDYHLGLAIGWQPHTASFLLRDVDSGTPQRFTFIRCNPKTRPTGATPAPPPLQLPPDPLHIHFCDAARTEIADDYYGATHQDPYAARAMLMRAKLAAIIACVESSQLVTEAHWQAAGTIVETSTNVRKWLQQQANEADAAAAEERVAERMVLAEATALASRSAEDNRLRDDARVMNYLRTHPGVKRKQVTNNAVHAGRNRLMAKPTIDRLLADGKVREDAEGNLWVADAAA